MAMSLAANEGVPESVRPCAIRQHGAMGRGSVREEVVQLMRAAERAPDQPFPGGADDADLADLQGRLGMPMPASLVDWLRVCKGEAIGPGGVYGARSDQPHNDIAETLSLFPGWRARGWIPVAGDGCGDYYVLIEHGELAGYIGFIDQADEDAISYLVASDLWLFLRFLFLSETGDRSWPFDREAVLAADSAMEGVPGDLMPWSGEG
jgi:cell wall assembly regulator SMI1